MEKAIETLRDADREIQSRFSPQLGKLASSYMSAVTDGRYEDVFINRDFTARTRTKDDVVARESEYLSAGTLDLMYLAVRLAICDMVLPEDKHIPLVLDDALINFDDARCAAALELLIKAAETRQILLLTCQHREAAYLSGRKNVNLVSL